MAGNQVNFLFLADSNFTVERVILLGFSADVHTCRQLVVHFSVAHILSTLVLRSAKSYVIINTMRIFCTGDDEGSEPPVRQGFHRSNLGQLCYHFLLAIFIGVSLRLTTFTEATTIAAALGGEYKVKTSFLVSFGFTKALSNLIVGRVSDLYGRKVPHSVGWVFGIFLGLMLLLLQKAADPSEDPDSRKFLMLWYTLANICLGAQQGWTWTTNIFMFMDILGPKHRALASSLSNSLGYLSSAATTYAAAKLTTEASFRLVLGTSVVAWLLATFLVSDTIPFVEQEVQQNIHASSILDYSSSHSAELWNDECQIEDGEEDHVPTKPSITAIATKGSYNLVQNTPRQSMAIEQAEPSSEISFVTSSFNNVFADTCWRNKSTAILCTGGLMANVVTSLAWGLVLIWGKQQGLSGLSLANIGSAFTFAKGIVMVLSGYLSDRKQSRKQVLMGGFVIALLGLIVTATADLSTDLDSIYLYLLLGGILIGSGIGSVYCVMTAALSDHTLPQDRASAIGVYKFWRDSGYAFGGILTGFVADASGGSFVFTTSLVAVLVGTLVVGIWLQYQEVPVPPDSTRT